MTKQISLGQVTFSKEDIIAFAKIYDAQAFHLSEEGGKASVFGALCASGWQTLMLWKKFYTPIHRGEFRSITQLQWKKPVFVGDTITFTFTEPNRAEAYNQHQETVMTFEFEV